MSDFYDLDFENINFREEPDKYRIGRGEQGIFKVEPYKSELLPHWAFKTPAIARESAEKIYAMYEDYKADGDFVGMDMARKFLMMGWTRARRYANHASGQKYDDDGNERPRNPDPEKAEAARIFKEKYDAVREDDVYQQMRNDHKQQHESG